MTMPPDDGTHALLGQILTKQGEMSVQLAVIAKTLEAIPDHEQRLRELERMSQQEAGGRDVWSRIIAGLALLAAVGSAAAQYLHP